MRGHVRKRGDKWCAVIELGRDPETRRRRQRWVSGFATKKAAEAGLVDLLSGANRGEPLDPSKRPLREYLHEWLRMRGDELSPTSIEAYDSRIRNHVEPYALGSMPLGKIRKAHMRSYERDLKDAGLGQPTLIAIRTVLSRALNDAVEDDLISVSPVSRVRRTERARSQTRFTVRTETELQALLEHVATDRLAALWRLAVVTGARRGELLGATWLGYSAEQKTISP